MRPARAEPALFGELAAYADFGAVSEPVAGARRKFRDAPLLDMTERGAALSSERKPQHPGEPRRGLEREARDSGAV